MQARLHNAISASTSTQGRWSSIFTQRVRKNVSQQKYPVRVLVRGRRPVVSRRSYVWEPQELMSVNWSEDDRLLELSQLGARS